MFFQNFEGFLDELRQIFVFPLSVVNLITNIYWVIMFLRLLFLNILKIGKICL